MNAASIIETILIRDSFQRLRSVYLKRLIGLTAGLLLLSLVGTWLLLTREPIYRYVMTDHAGGLVDLVPMHLPKHDEDFVAKWAVAAVTKAYSFDFVNARSQLQQARADMTVAGWHFFEEALRASGNYQAIISNKYAATAVPLAPPRITRSGLYSGRYAWNVEFPLLVTYQSSVRRTNQELKITALVIRQPEYLQPDGLGLRQIIAE